MSNNQAHDLEVFVLCFNRPKMAMETILSLCGQSYPNLRIIVSDNSTRTPLDAQVVTALPRTEYRRRDPSLSPEEHFNTIINEASAPFFMMVHDDDLYDPSCILNLIEAIKAKPEAAAISPNARMLWGETPSRTLINPSLPSNIEFKNVTAFLRRYFRPDFGINPFPGYLYRRSAVGAERLDSKEAGKYSDATFLCRILHHGSILWLSSALMQYRRHAQNDSGVLEWRQTHRLVQWAIARGYFLKSDLDARVFRYWIHLLRIRDLRRGGKTLNRRELVAVIKFFASHPWISARIIFQKFKHRIVWFG